MGASKVNGYKPPVKSVVLRHRGAVRGVRLISYDSLMEFLFQESQKQNPSRYNNYGIGHSVSISRDRIPASMSEVLKFPKIDLPRKEVSVLTCFSDGRPAAQILLAFRQGGREVFRFLRKSRMSCSFVSRAFASCLFRLRSMTFVLPHEIESENLWWLQGGVTSKRFGVPKNSFPLNLWMDLYEVLFLRALSLAHCR